MVRGEGGWGRWRATERKRERTRYIEKEEREGERKREEREFREREREWREREEGRESGERGRERGKRKEREEKVRESERARGLQPCASLPHTIIDHVTIHFSQQDKQTHPLHCEAGHNDHTLNMWITFIIASLFQHHMR